MKHNILVLENESFARHLVRALQLAGFQSGALVRADDALRVVRDNPFVTGVSVDFNLFGTTTGVDFAASVREIRPAVKCVLLSANLEGARKHPRYVPGLFVRELEKPFKPDEYAAVWLELLAESVDTEQASNSPADQG